MAANWSYLPILKWKQGERIAVSKLTASEWAPITVLVEPQAIDAAPDATSLRAALPAYLSKLAKEFQKSIPEGKAIPVDVRYVSPGYPRQVRLLSTICQALQRLAERQIIPVVTQTMAASESADLGSLKPFDEWALRINASAVDPSQVADLAKLVRDGGIRRTNLHLVVDQESLVNANPAAQAAVIVPFLDAALACGCASTTVAGGSFPVNLIGIKQGFIDLPRVEWRVWQQLRALPQYEALRYGDYTVSNPAPVPQMDPTMVNPSVAIRYAADGFWRLFKAGGFKKGKPDQYRQLCQLLLSDAVYSGSTFSYGDDCYDKAANAKLGNGNPSSWRRDATNHHLVLTASSL